MDDVPGFQITRRLKRPFAILIHDSNFSVSTSRSQKHPEPRYPTRTNRSLGFMAILYEITAQTVNYAWRTRRIPSGKQPHQCLGRETRRGRSYEHIVGNAPLLRMEFEDSFRNGLRRDKIPWHDPCPYRPPFWRYQIHNFDPDVCQRQKRGCHSWTGEASRLWGWLR